MMLALHGAKADTPNMIHRRNGIGESASLGGTNDKPFGSTVDTSKGGSATIDHLKVFATSELADEWFQRMNDPEGRCFSV